VLKNNNDISRERLVDWLTENPEKPATTEQVVEAEDALINYAKAHSLAPPDFLRERILAKLTALDTQANTRKKLQIDNLPLLTDNVNWLDWKELVEGIEPPDNFDNIHLHSIESNDKRELFVAWVKEMVEEEVHDDLLESFLILEGSCECHISNEKGETRIVRLGQGDSITMQIGETHDIVITSLQPAKAILEWRKLAA
jgi:mannose-6-phosphate isomerase-like protein (cupin superfamily)